MVDDATPKPGPGLQASPDVMASGIHFARWVLPVSAPPVENGYLTVKNGIIQSIGPITELSEAIRRESGPKIEQALQAGYLLTPGLINAHTHLEQSVGHIQPYPRTSKSDQADMIQWLLAAKPVLDKLREDPAYADQALGRGIREIQTSGVTGVNDISRNGRSITALTHANLRGVVSIEFFHPEAGIIIEPLLQQTLALYQDLSRQHSQSSTITVGLSPHSPYNVSPIAWHWMLERAQPSVIHTHLAESKAECAYLGGNPQTELTDIQMLHQAFVGKTFSPKAFSISPTQYLVEHDLLTNGLIAAHGVEVDSQDIKALARSHVHVVHCPRSNEYLLGKTLDWHAYKQAQVLMALGTDGHLSSPSLDVRAEARVARILHNLSPAGTLALLTMEAAEILGLQRHIGSLEPGKKADLALWKPEAATHTRSPEEQWLSATTSCIGSWVDGKACYHPA